MNTAPLSQFQPDKSDARRAFEQAASSYDEAAVLQRAIGEQLLERLQMALLDPKFIIDLGAGTGVGTRALNAVYPTAELLAVDFAPAMLRLARQRAPTASFICADAEQLPLSARSVDLIYSNLLLQWCPNLETLFGELLRVLRPGGELFFATFGPDTLQELREAWRQVDSGVHVHAFLDMHIVGDQLLQSGFTEVALDVERYQVTYPTLLTLFRDLKGLGAHNVAPSRSRGLLGKSSWRKLQSAYQNFRQGESLPATYEVIYGHAKAPAAPRLFSGELTADGNGAAEQHPRACFRVR